MATGIYDSGDLYVEFSGDLYNDPETLTTFFDNISVERVEILGEFVDPGILPRNALLDLAEQAVWD